MLRVNARESISMYFSMVKVYLVGIFCRIMVECVTVDAATNHTQYSLHFHEPTNTHSTSSKNDKLKLYQQKYLKLNTCLTA